MRITALFLLGAFAACSSSLPLDAGGSRRAEYEDYLDDHLQLDRLYLNLRETAKARALLITPRIIELQSQIAPGFQLKTSEAKTYVVVSLEMQDWSRFSISDYKFFLGDRPAISVKEVMDEQLIRTFYPFAVPHDRVFVAEFEGVDLEPALRVQTSPGQFVFNLGAALK